MFHNLLAWQKKLIISSLFLVALVMGTATGTVLVGQTQIFQSSAGPLCSGWAIPESVHCNTQDCQQYTCGIDGNWSNAQGFGVCASHPDCNSFPLCGGWAQPNSVHCNTQECQQYTCGIDGNWSSQQGFGVCAGHPDCGGGGNNGGGGSGWTAFCSNGNLHEESDCNTQTIFNNTWGIENGCSQWQSEACASENPPASVVEGTCDSSCGTGGGGSNDQCDSTPECVAIYGSSAIDCEDSQTENSWCECGEGIRCDEVGNIPPNPPSGSCETNASVSVTGSEVGRFLISYSVEEIGGDCSGETYTAGWEGELPLTHDLGFSLTNYGVNCTPGIVKTMILNSPGDTASDTELCPNYENNLPSIVFYPDSYNVRVGDDVKLNWTAINAQSCEAYHAWSGSKPVVGSESVRLDFHDVLFGLECTNSNGSNSVVVRIRDLESIPKECEKGKYCINWGEVPVPIGATLCTVPEDEEHPLICCPGSEYCTETNTCGECGFQSNTSSMTPGDANKDGFVDVLDYAFLIEHWGESVDLFNVKADFNGDGKVGALDYAVLFDNWSI